MFAAPLPLRGNGVLGMLLSRRWTALVFCLPLVAMPLVEAQDSRTPSHKAKSKHKVQKKAAPPQLVLPPLPSGPLKQVPMDQIPANPPKVTFESGLLAIEADNATLGEILRDVRKLTGASIDIPQGGAPERVVIQVGPGAPRDVLALLLNGTSFNYVMLGSAADPSAVSTVLLTPKPGGADAQVQTASNTYRPNSATGQPIMPPTRMPGPQPFRQAAPTNAQPDAASDDNSDDSENNGNEDKDEDSDQAQPAQPGAAQPDGNSEGQPATDPNQPNAGPRTPEQILQMMRQGQQTLPQPQPQPNGNPPQN